MKKLFITLCMTGLIAVLSSCGTSRNAASSAASLDGEWKIVEVNGQAIPQSDSENEAFLGFDTKEKRMYGSTSCNRMFGGIEIDAKKGTISFGNMGSTRMMCADMKTETMVLDAMNKVNAFDVQKNGTLTLKSSDGKKLIVLEKKDKK